EVSDYELMTEKHCVIKVCKLHTIIDCIKDSETLIQIVSSIRKKKALDVIELIQKKVALHPGSMESIMIDEVLSTGGECPVSTDDLFKALTMLGRKQEEFDLGTIDIRTTLITADLKRRKGKILEAMQLFFNLLNSRTGLEPGYWIVCLVGWITCINISEGSGSALTIIERYLSLIDNPAHRSLLYYIQADILSDIGENEKATERYYKSLRIMRVSNMPVTKAELLNSYGVHLFRSGQYDLAEKKWIKCRNLSNKYNIPWMKAIAEINLADSYSRKGKIRSAHDLLRKAQKVLREIGDLEGVSGVNFNKALVYVREGKINRAYMSFEASDEFPLVYESKKKERRRVFDECLIENGYSPRT
ncbi:MAG: tetratricopeptide repeat protein, partial [Candidatus Thermoplasmatota archaeon]|nr:tetratricopeptide repeat protein [Candidatus Thermoplasmatota archaeon]